MGQHHIRIRAGAVAASATTALVVTVGWVVDGMDSADAAVTRICSVALIVALGWGWLGVLAGAREAWRLAGGPARSRSDEPVGLRRLVLTACGVALTGALAAGAAQAQAAPRVPDVAATAAWPSAPGVGQATVVTTDAAEPAPATAVTVHRGDSLWSIAASQVQPGAGPMTVTARWRALYRANRAVIGADPDLIHPGQRLRPPR